MRGGGDGLAIVTAVGDLQVAGLVGVMLGAAATGAATAATDNERVAQQQVIGDAGPLVGWGCAAT